MPRFYLPPSAIRDRHFSLSGTEAHHAIHVLRKEAGDTIELFDGQDASYRGRIDRIEGDHLEGTLLEEAAAARIPIEVVLCQALTRGAKWDWLLEKACEIGVAKLCPVITRRSLIKLSAREAASKVARWNRISVAACKQSGRSELMTVEAPKDLTGVLSQIDAGSLALIPYEKETQRTVRQACDSYQGKRVYLFIGPEGGWDPHEVIACERHGVRPVRLGPTLLRTETAGLVAATLVLRELGVY